MIWSDDLIELCYRSYSPSDPESLARRNQELEVENQDLQQRLNEVTAMHALQMKLILDAGPRINDAHGGSGD